MLVDWEGYKTYLLNKYRRKNWAMEMFRTTRRNLAVISNPSLLDACNKSESTRNKILQGLIAFAKYQGFNEEFKSKLKAY